MTTATHRPIGIYSGGNACLKDGECYFGLDYTEVGGKGEDHEGAWCPHVTREATICLNCSTQDEDGDWPEETSVPWPCSVASQQSGEAS